MWLGKIQNKTKLKSLIRFHSANNIDNYNKGGKEKKNKKDQKKWQNKSKHKNSTCFSWVTTVGVFSLTEGHSPPHLPRRPSNTVLGSGPAVGSAQSLPTWSYGFNLQLIQLVGRLGVIFLSHTDLGLNCGFISSSACGLFTGVCSWGCLGGLGSAPVRVRWEGGAAAWVMEVLAAPGTQGSWQLGQQEIQNSRRVWQTVLVNALQYSCLENPSDR